MGLDLEKVLIEPYGPFCEIQNIPLFRKLLQSNCAYLGAQAEDMYDPQKHLEVTLDVKNPEEAIFDLLRPSDEALKRREAFLKEHGIDKYWTIFPRTKRPSSDATQEVLKSIWPEERWIELVESLYAQWGIPFVAVGVRGKGCYGGVGLVDYASEACYSLIPECSELEGGRGLDLQIALHQGASLAVGTRGGAGILAMLCGCQTLLIVDKQHFERFKTWREWFNLKKSYFVCIPDGQIRDYSVKEFQKEVNLLWGRFNEN
jgi:hypothetical protein